MNSKGAFSTLLSTEKDTEGFATFVSNLVKNGDVITLSGELGSGKTTFTRALIRKVSNVTEDIISPTFNLLQIYDCSDFQIWHLDLYRIESERDVEELGLDDALGEELLIIEWPEKIENLLPNNKLDIKLEYTSNKGERRVTCSYHDERWNKLNDYR